MELVEGSIALYNGSGLKALDAKRYISGQGRSLEDSYSLYPLPGTSIGRILPTGGFSGTFGCYLKVDHLDNGIQKTRMLALTNHHVLYPGKQLHFSYGSRVAYRYYIM